VLLERNTWKEQQRTQAASITSLFASPPNSCTSLSPAMW